MKNIDLFAKEQQLNATVEAVRKHGYKKAAINSMLYKNAKLINDRISTVRDIINENTDENLKPLLERVGNQSPDKVLNKEELELYNSLMPEYTKYVDEMLALDVDDVQLEVINVDKLELDLDIDTEFLLRNFEA